MSKFFLVILIIAVIVFAPFLTIWSISTLWDVSAVYDFWHWLAALLFSGLIAAGKSK